MEICRTSLRSAASMNSPQVTVTGLLREALQRLLGGLAGKRNLQLQSGMPVTVTQATNNNSFAGFALQRPNLVGNPRLSPGQRNPARYFNTAAFTPAPQFTIGNASRNPVRGPHIELWTLPWSRTRACPRASIWNFARNCSTSQTHLLSLNQTEALARPPSAALPALPLILASRNSR